MMKLILWEMERSFTSTDPAERMKHTLAMCEMVKKSMEAGQMKAWGINPGGHNGFAITDSDEKEILMRNAQYIPYVKFRVEPMLSIDEVIQALKGAQP